jgi:hypothetical protein
MRARALPALVAVAVMAGTGSAGAQTVGSPLDRQEIAGLAARFADNPFTGGQVAPRLYRWVNRDVAIFVQFDRPNAAEAATLRFVGIGVKGVFCAEAQPGGPRGGFTHFHRVDAPQYAVGHGGPPGQQGYWLMWVAVDEFDLQGQGHVTPGVARQLFITPPPRCGDDVPRPAFQAPGAHILSRAEIRRRAAPFTDDLLRGGQEAPRVYKWVNREVAIFLQFDEPRPSKARRLRYIGISKRGTFCSSSRPSRDFAHFHRVRAREYSEGHGGRAGARGYWLATIAVDEFRASGIGRVRPGLVRDFFPTPPPRC